MDNLLKSLEVVTQNWPVVIGLLGLYLLGSASLFFWLKTSLGSRLTSGELTAVSLGGGFLPLFLGLIPVFALGFFGGVKLNFILIWLVVLGLSGLLFFLTWRRNRQTAALETPRTGFPALWAGLLLLVFLLTLTLRLAFIAGLTVPLYFDSVMHYSIIADLIAKFNQASLPDFNTFVGGYYHLGYHLLTTALGLALQAQIAPLMLVFGQILLALLPLPLFFIVRRETQSDLAALFASLLAAWGWSMPAYAVNWGKYPALASLLAFEVFICSVYLLLAAPREKRWFLTALSGFSLLVSGLMHTRSLILIALALASAALAFAWSKLPRPARWISFLLVCAGLAALIWVLESKPALQLVFDPYRETAPWLALPLLLLLPLAVKTFPRATLTGLLFITFCLGSVLFSVTYWLPAYQAQTLLDRPLVEMLLSTPLAFLGGLGCAGLLQALRESPFLQAEARQTAAQVLVTLALFGLTGYALTQAPLTPSDCCNFFNPDDLTAFAWMDKNLPATARILVAATPGSVFEDGPEAVYSGSDAGLWVTLLLKRTSLVLSNGVNFNTAAVHDKLCQYAVTQIYVGSRGADSFDPENLRQAPNWYQAQMEFPTTQVFRLTGCP
jgi:hypothetical protein